MKNISYFVRVYGGSKDPGFSYFFDYVSFHGFIWTIIVLSVTSMISNCLMLYGIRKNIPGFLIAWLSINLILLIVSTYMGSSSYANICSDVGGFHLIDFIITELKNHMGSFHLVDWIITELKDHMTCYAAFNNYVDKKRGRGGSAKSPRLST